MDFAPSHKQLDSILSLCPHLEHVIIDYKSSLTIDDTEIFCKLATSEVTIISHTQMHCCLLGLLPDCFFFLGKQCHILLSDRFFATKLC